MAVYASHGTQAVSSVEHITNNLVDHAKTVIKNNDGKVTESFVLAQSRTGAKATRGQAGEHGGTLSAKAIQLLDSGKTGQYVLIHNHPLSGSFSLDDIDLLISTNSIGTLVAAGHDGKVYTLSIGDGNRLGREELYKQWKEVMQKDDINDLETQDRVLNLLANVNGWKYARIEV